MENEQYIESGLSVGTTKIANKYEIFTEEEVDIINNKIPELDERVSIIEYEIEDINSSLGDKASKNEVFSMANMGQDIKEAMTGGSVAVVGVNSINSINLLKNSVTKSKTDFFNPNVINLLNLANSEITNINYSTGVKPSYICDDNSITCNTKDEDWLFFFIKLNLEVGKTYTCTLRNTNLNRDMDVGISYVNQPTEPKKFTFTKNNGEYKLTFECVSETNYIRIHGINGGINIKDIIFYEGAEDVVWTLDKDIYVTNISDGAISHEKLSDDIKQLFIKVEDLFNINGFEFLTGINVETFINNNDDTFYVEFNEGSSYLVFKGQQFKKGHKYVVTYDVTGDVDFNFGLRNSVIGYPNWQQIIIETTNQTGGATSAGYKIYNCEYDGCLGFNNSCSKAVKYTAKIKIFDVTEYTNKEIKKIDFLAAGHSDIVTNISDGAISHEKLSDDIKQLFIKVEDLFNINGFEFLTGINVETFINNNDDTFYVEFNEGSSYLVFKGQQFKKGHKYVVTYDVTGDVDFNFGLRNSVIGYPNWQQIIIETTNQTGGATSAGYKIYNCEYDGCLGFNNSCSKAVKYTAKIKIFDVTEYTDEEIKKIDFLSVGHSAMFVKNVGSGESSTSSNALANKKIVFYGDSISQSGYFQNMVKNYFDCDVVTNAIGGTTIGYQGSSCFSADERISQLPTDADLVLIMGGTNDWNRVNIGTIDFSSSSIDRTTIKGGLLYTIKGIQEQCPKATIIVCTAIGGRGSSGSSSHLYPLVDKYGQSTLDIRNATIEVANIANVECCDTWSCGINGFNRTKYIVDTVHPNTEGNKLIGNYIINFLKKYN